MLEVVFGAMRTKIYIRGIDMARHIVNPNNYLPKEEVQVYNQKTEEQKQKELYVNSEHPSTVENGTATLLYIIIMFIGTIFVDRILIWIAASIIYFRFINRRKIKEKKWEKMKQEKEGNK